MSSQPWHIRRATSEDVPAIRQLIVELATYERAPEAVLATEQDLHDALFGEDPSAEAHVGELQGEVVAFALWYRTFSTWQGKPGMWLEDLYVQPEHRGSGLGKALLSTLANICLERGWTRFEWWVLDWNTPAAGFYTSLGAVPEEEWTVWRVDGAELDALATADVSSGTGQPRPPADQALP